MCPKQDRTPSLPTGTSMRSTRARAEAPSASDRDALHLRSATGTAAPAPTRASPREKEARRRVGLRGAEAWWEPARCPAVANPNFCCCSGRVSLAQRVRISPASSRMRSRPGVSRNIWTSYFVTPTRSRRYSYKQSAVGQPDFIGNMSKQLRLGDTFVVGK